MHDLALERIPLLRLTVPDQIIEQGTRNEIFREHGLLPEQASKRILEFVHLKSQAFV